jgi:hypothetical protein
MSVLVNYRCGQLANRMFHFSYFIANSIKYKYKLVYPCFGEYLQYFDCSQKANLFGGMVTCEMVSGGVDRYIRKILQIIGSVLAKLGIQNNRLFEYHNIVNEYDSKNKEFDLNDSTFVRAARSKFVIASGWRYRDYTNFERYSDEIRKIFTPKEVYMNSVDRVVDDCKQKGNIIVGVHIRGGDYRTYLGGRFFYENQVYRDKMLEMQELLKEKGECVFLICSNEPVKIEDFEGMQIVTEARHFIVDLFSLSKCDYIIGPPSTFSWWASFYGSVPVIFLEKPNQRIQLDEFRISKG